MSLNLPSPLFANPDPSLKFTTLTNIVALLNQLAANAIDTTDFTPYVKGSSVPDVDDQDKVWHRTDVDGEPLGTYIYFNGLWVREPPTPGARIGLYTGDSNLFDGTGLGIPGPGPIAGDLFGWALANGLNGTANLSNQFIIAGAMDNAGITGFSGGLWRTKVIGGALTQGGTATQTLTADTGYYPDIPAIEAGTHWKADGNSRDDAEGLWGDGPGDPIHIQDAIDGNTTPDPFNIVPPFYCMAIIAFRGYN